MPVIIYWVIYLSSGMPSNQGQPPFETCIFSSLLIALLKFIGHVVQVE